MAVAYGWRRGGGYARAMGSLAAARRHVSATAKKAAVGVRRSTAIRNLVHMPLTVAGFFFIDVSAFLVNVAFGFFSLGVLLLVLEHIAADER